MLAISGVCVCPVSIGLTANAQANHSNAGEVGRVADRADVGEKCGNYYMIDREDDKFEKRRRYLV